MMTANTAPTLAGLEDASDVTHSTAYSVLNTLVDEGLILDERADYLKQKFKDLHTRVLTIYKRDNLLLKRARQLRSELDRERDHVKTRGDAAKKDDEEIQKLKRTLVGLEKELNEAQERESILQVEALEYDRRRQTMILEREDAQAAEEARLRPRMEAVQTEIAEMGNAIKELIGQHADLQKALDSTIDEEARCKSEIVNFTATVAQMRQQYTNVEHDPERASKQVQLVLRSLQSAQKELSAAEEKCTAQMEVISKLELQRSNRSVDMNAAEANLQKVKNDIEAKRKTLAAINTSLDMELESRQGYQDRLTELEMLLKSTRISAQQEDDGVDRMQREKGRCVKEFTTIEHAHKELIHEQQSLKEHLTLLQKNAALLEARRKANKVEIDDAKKKVEVRTRQLLREQAKEKDFTEKANLVLEDLTDAAERVTARALQYEVKRRELLALVTRRQEMNREAAKEGSRVVLIKNEALAKNLQLQELKHRKQELEKRLGSLVESFQNVKRERSHRTALIQAITQKMTETGEKTKILENELEVLVREAAVKEQELIKKKRVAHEAQQVVAKLRLEKNKLRKKAEVALDAEKEVRARVRRMNLEVAAAEDVMTGLKETYTTAIESRNQSGIQLIDRNDTMSLLVEKVKAQEVAIEQGTHMTTARAEEVKRLKILLSDLLRGIDVCQKSIPKVKQLEAELERVTSEIDDEHWRIEVLENELTDHNNANRWRRLERQKPTSEGGESSAATSVTGQTGGPGKAATATTSGNSTVTAATTGAPSEEFVRLQARTQDIESRLNAINEKQREKELILAEVRELSDRIGSQAESGREFTLALAKQMNQYQGGIRAKTRQMMATISELSLFQASSIQLQQEVERLEAIVEEAEGRLQQGDAPFAEAEEEYERQKEANQRYAEATRRAREEAREAALVGPNTVITTAEPRANAYVPEGGLGIPRPFGAQAPFMPTKAPLKSNKALLYPTVQPSQRSQNAGGAAAVAAAPAAGPSPSSGSSGQSAAVVPASLKPTHSNNSGRGGTGAQTGPIRQSFPGSIPASGRQQANEEGTAGRSSAPPQQTEQLRLSQRNLSASH